MSTTMRSVGGEPPEADLARYFSDNRELFRIPELVTFEQIFFSPRIRADAVAADTETALAALRQGADPAGFGDSTPLDGRFEAAEPDRVRILFGEALTAAVFAEPLAIWLGPFESDFGLHLVRVVDRSPPRDPDFAEVAALVRAAYAADRRERANAEAFAEMRSYFEIAVEWAEGSEPVPWP